MRLGGGGGGEGVEGQGDRGVHPGHPGHVQVVGDALAEDDLGAGGDGGAGRRGRGEDGARSGVGGGRRGDHPLEGAGGGSGGLGRMENIPDGRLEQHGGLAGDLGLGAGGEDGGGLVLGRQADHPARLAEAHQARLLPLGQHGEVLRRHDQARLAAWPRRPHHHLALAHHPVLGGAGGDLGLELELASWCGDQLAGRQLQLLTIGELELLARA